MRSTDPKARAITGVALDLAETNFEREYASGRAGVVMPGVFAVDSEGSELTRIAVLPEVPGHVPSDQLYAQLIEQAVASVPKGQGVAAWAAVRIDVGWPRILAWHSSGTTCQARPRFVGDRLTDWHEDWGEGFSDAVPEGSDSGLVELEMKGVSGAGLALIVRERLEDEGHR